MKISESTKHLYVNIQFARVGVGVGEKRSFCTLGNMVAKFMDNLKLTNLTPKS